MLKGVNEILIGKDITRTAALVDGADVKTIQENIVEGEVVVLNKDFEVAAAAITYSDSDVLYIAEGSSETFDYANEAGTAFSGRRLILSAPINGKGVKLYSGKAYSAKPEQVTTIPAISDSIVAGTEYVLRLVYKDIPEHPGQFTQTYRYVAKSGDTSTDVFDGLRKRIVKHTGRLAISGKGGSRVTANALGQASLILTGKAIPECTTSVKDIDELTQVYFEAYLNYVDSNGFWTEVGLSTAKSTVAHGRGNGTWEVIRDVEKRAKSYRGIENRIWFPVFEPEFRTLKGAEYGQIVIEHDAEYRSSDNQYNKETSLTTVIAVANETGTNQGVNIQTRLNAWMTSLPKSFAAIAIFS